MIEYRLPCCMALAFEADTPVRGGPIRVKCHRCKVKVTPHAFAPVLADYECARCRSRETRLGGPGWFGFCVPCGVPMRQVPDRPPVERPATVAYVSVSVV